MGRAISAAAPVRSDARERDPLFSSADVERLLRASLDLAGAHEVAKIADIVRGAARELTGADGVTFVLREGRLVHYLDEDAIAPLWKGMRFRAEACISGWVMAERRPVAIEDVFADDRIPHDLYRPTFVRSMAMVPVRPEDPVAAIGAYWAQPHRPGARELHHLTALAGFASVALANAALVSELREAIAARDTFLGVASHELRTPLAALTLQVAMAERRVGPEAGEGGLRPAVERIGRSARRLTELVERLLDVSMPGQARAQPQPEPVDLAAVAREAASALGEPGRTEVRVSADGPVVGRWDRLRIEQVVQNLVANAVKFGSGSPVDVAVSAARGEARLVVRDRGIGIPAEAQARIFDRFERAASDRNYGGFGLGLWLVREAVEAHGGAVSVESAAGAGATFTVTLPLG